ncbi:MAG: hypothetical protein EBS60_09545, partial [Verrucomicrobia bacterium]|nr:hypothetical protein [Verrucomicrobiota bacterium]
MRWRAILLFGAPGSGKGTQGKVLGTIPAFCHISCGDVFRGMDLRTQVGQAFLKYSSAGKLVPDEVTVDLWRQHMAHALSLLLVMLLAAPMAFHVPLPALSAILVFVAWNMGEWHAFTDVQQFRWPYRLTLLAVFVLTVAVDLSVAVAVGLGAATLTFLFHISSLTRSEVLWQDPQTQVLRLQGALFFGAVNLIEQRSDNLPSQ